MYMKGGNKKGKSFSSTIEPVVSRKSTTSLDNTVIAPLNEISFYYREIRFSGQGKQEAGDLWHILSSNNHYCPAQRAAQAPLTGGKGRQCLSSPK